MESLNSKLNVIDKLIEQCEQSKLVFFSYQDDMFSIRFSKVNSDVDQSSDVIKQTNDLNELNDFEFTEISQIEEQVDEDAVTVVSPYVGTIEFSDQMKVEDDNIHVEKGDVLCSIEAMKIYNDIKAPVSGTVVEINVEDCSMVEFDQPILKIRADKDE